MQFKLWMKDDEGKTVSQKGDWDDALQEGSNRVLRVCIYVTKRPKITTRQEIL
jgi:hypothetical protein